MEPTLPELPSAVTVAVDALQHGLRDLDILADAGIKDEPVDPSDTLLCTTKVGSKQRIRRSEPTAQFEQQVELELERIKHQQNTIRDGRSPTLPFDINLHERANALKNVHDFWVDSGIWAQEWVFNLASGTYLFGKVWAHEHSPTTVGSNSKPHASPQGIGLNTLQLAPQEKNIPTSELVMIADRSTKQRSCPYKKAPYAYAKLTVRDYHASKPRNQFLRQVDREVLWLIDELTWKTGAEEIDIDQLARLRVKERWINNGIWNPVWENADLPGEAWRHEGTTARKIRKSEPRNKYTPNKPQKRKRNVDDENGANDIPTEQARKKAKKTKQPVPKHENKPTVTNGTAVTAKQPKKKKKTKKTKEVRHVLHNISNTANENKSTAKQIPKMSKKAKQASRNINPQGELSGAMEEKGSEGEQVFDLSWLVTQLDAQLDFNKAADEAVNEAGNGNNSVTRRPLWRPRESEDFSPWVPNEVEGTYQWTGPLRRSNRLAGKRALELSEVL